MELNIGSLAQLKKSIQEHKKDDFGDERSARGKKHSYENDKLQVVDRIDRILEYKAKIDRWLDDIGEMLARLKKQEVTFLEEKESVKESAPKAEILPETDTQKESPLL